MKLGNGQADRLTYSISFKSSTASLKFLTESDLLYTGPVAEV